MKDQKEVKKKYEGLKFDLLKTPINVDINKTYNTIANPVIKNDDKKEMNNG